jgi:hypothetical protein
MCPEKIYWTNLCRNPSAIHLIEQNMSKIDWSNLSGNTGAIHLLERNRERIHWCEFSRNPSIFELDPDFLHQRMNLIRDELMEKAWHPSRIEWLFPI